MSADLALPSKLNVSIAVAKSESYDLRKNRPFAAQALASLPVIGYNKLIVLSRLFWIGLRLGQTHLIYVSWCMWNEQDFHEVSLLYHRYFWYPITHPTVVEYRLILSAKRAKREYRPGAF